MHRLVLCLGVNRGPSKSAGRRRGRRTRGGYDLCDINVARMNTDRTSSAPGFVAHAARELHRKILTCAQSTLQFDGAGDTVES